MDDIAKLGAQDLVIFVHHIEAFGAVLGGFRRGREGEGLPLRRCELLGADGGWNAQSAGDFFPVVFEFRKQIPQLFSAFGKTPTHERFKDSVIEWTHLLARLAPHRDHGGVHLRSWMKNRGRKFAFQTDVPTPSRAERHRAVVTRVGCRAEALGELELQCQNQSGSG